MYCAVAKRATFARKRHRQCGLLGACADDPFDESQENSHIKRQRRFGGKTIARSLPRDASKPKYFHTEDNAVISRQSSHLSRRGSKNPNRRNTLIRRRSMLGAQGNSSASTISSTNTRGRRGSTDAIIFSKTYANSDWTLPFGC